jgi:hypothetical protein
VTDARHHLRDLGAVQWLGGRSSNSVTVPISLSPSKAPRMIRSPRSAALSEFDQNAPAAACDSDA